MPFPTCRYDNMFVEIDWDVRAVGNLSTYDPGKAFSMERTVYWDRLGRITFMICDCHIGQMHGKQ
jgi:hypothetical protein